MAIPNSVYLYFEMNLFVSFNKKMLNGMNPDGS
jgi:hypothetical protein